MNKPSSGSARNKPVLWAEAAYFLGLVILARGTAWMERADFGMSMVVAPAYIVHRKLSQFWPWFTFGVAEYLLQAVLLVLLATVQRQFKRAYLFSFVTAVLYGVVLDSMLWLTAFLPGGGMIARVLYYLAGLLLCSVGVALLFYTYLPPEAYELVVKELAERFSIPIARCKTIYDCTSCLVGVVLSFAFFGFGRFEGVKLGTVFCALINGTLIGWCSDLLQEHFRMEDALTLRNRFR